MKYRVLVLDLDGTLTNSKKEITEYTKNVLLSFQKEGGIIVLASGRPPYGIIPLAHELMMDTYGGYILAFNGGKIIQCSDGKVIFQTTIPVELKSALYKFSKQNNVVILTYKNERIITENPFDQYVIKEKMLNKMDALKVESFDEYVDYPVDKCLMVADETHLAKVEIEAKKTFGDALSIYRSEPYFLEVVPKGIDKAKSLEWLFGHIGIDKLEIAACGDGYNDQTMIEYAGLGVAMENAQDLVKKAADLIAPSNDHDGVAWVVENYILN